MFYPDLHRSETHSFYSFSLRCAHWFVRHWSIEPFSKSDHINRNDPSSYKLSDWFEVSYDLVCHWLMLISFVTPSVIAELIGQFMCLLNNDSGPWDYTSPVGFMLPGRPIAMMMCVRFNSRGVVGTDSTADSRPLDTSRWRKVKNTRSHLCFVTHSSRVAMQFTADFKLGHYMKVPPRPMFWAQVCAVVTRESPTGPNSFQVVATMIAGTVQLGVQSW